MKIAGLLIEPQRREKENVGDMIAVTKMP